MDGRTDGWMDGRMDGRTDGWTDGRMDGRTENLPILQDFVPYRGRCPATAQLQPKNCVKQGKGTADHMMPLGDWFFLPLLQSLILHFRDPRSFTLIL